MMRFARPSTAVAKGELRMSAMIDIVFLLLVFFVMTFRIVPQEGDFNIDMLEATRHTTQPVMQMPLRLRLIAADDGSLAELRMNGRELKSRQELRQLLLALHADADLQAQTLHLACDDKLAYDEVIKTLDVVTGRRDEFGNVHPLATKVRFVAPQ